MQAFFSESRYKSEEERQRKRELQRKNLREKAENSGERPGFSWQPLTRKEIPWS